MRSAGSYRNDPRTTTMQYDGKCAETGVLLRKGTTALYYPSSKEFFSLQSLQYGEYLNWKQDCNDLDRPY